MKKIFISLSLIFISLPAYLAIKSDFSLEKLDAPARFFVRKIGFEERFFCRKN